MREVIEFYLVKRKLTYYKLSMLTGISKSRLYDFKRGVVKNLSFLELSKISVVLDFSLDEIREKYL
ncbi:helix-turn-helix domain-containing protein [Gemella morbillorum]